MKKILILTAATAALFLCAAALPTWAEDPNNEPCTRSEGCRVTKPKLSECLTMLQGLNALDGHQVIVAAGKPNEQVVNQPYDFGNAALRLDVAKNLSALAAVQRDAQAAQQKIAAEISKGGEIKPGSPENFALDRQMRELLDRPCDVALKRIRAADLKLEKNEIPASVLAAIDLILDR